MSINNIHKVSEKELDNLLGQAFLNLDFNNPKNQELMETISNHVLPTSPVSAGFINKALPDDQREVLEMRMYQDLSFKEIADSTGVSINTALGRMRYALMNLRKVIEKNQIILTN